MVMIIFLGISGVYLIFDRVSLFLEHSRLYINIICNNFLISDTNSFFGIGSLDLFDYIINYKLIITSS